jgi:hypothetical protein
MNKYLAFFLASLSFVQISNAQFLWYENESSTEYIEYVNTTAGTFVTNITNPNVTGINVNSIVSNFNKDEDDKAFLRFDLHKNVTSLSNFSITIKAYLDIPTESLTSNNSKIRMYLSSSEASKQIYKQLNFTVGQEWESFTFDFDGSDISEEVEAVNGYNRMFIGFANGNVIEPPTTYYIDSIVGTTDQEPHPAAWLSGSWGVTFPIYGGERLDSEVKGGYDYIAGAQQIIDSLSATGHIITNLSNFAKSYYFTLRGNENVDIAAEIDESFVPSLENEAIIFDVLQMFKDAGKKNILYISTNYFDRLDDETHALWVNYYTNKFAGDEYLAYKDLVQGFILRIKDYADAYWLDTTSELYNDGHLEDFVEMIRTTDTEAAISVTGVGAAYFQKDGEHILVDSDGLDDEDERDYKIIKFEGVNTYQDFTRGHVTPLGQGAPPNSWAYEEFTLPAMVENPWSIFEGNEVLKHAWFPMRQKWHVSSANLIFGTEDAYRFAKTLIDAKAGVTFATTINDNGNGKGYMMPDEMVIMKEINDRLLSNPIPDFEPYVRPEGAYLVGETLSTNFHNPTDIKFYPNPVIDELTITRKSTGINHIEVISIIGTKVIQKTWNKESLTTQLNVSTLKPGIYFVKLSNGKSQSIHQKIIVSK